MSEFLRIGLIGICVFIFTFCTLTLIKSDVKVQETEKAYGFLNVTVENVAWEDIDPNKTDRDTHIKYFLNMDKIVSIRESDLSSKKVPRTEILTDNWYAPVFVCVGSVSDVLREFNNVVNSGGFIGNSPFPRFGDAPKEDPKDKGHPDKGHPDKAKRTVDK